MPRELGTVPAESRYPQVYAALNSELADFRSAMQATESVMRTPEGRDRLEAQHAGESAAADRVWDLLQALEQGNVKPATLYLVDKARNRYLDAVTSTPSGRDDLEKRRKREQARVDVLKALEMIRELQQ